MSKEPAECERRGRGTLRLRASRWAAGLVAAVVASLCATPALACRYPPDRPQLLASYPTWMTEVLRIPTERGETCPIDAHTIAGRITGTLSNGGVVFLGEVHDNAAHHKLRAELLARSIPAATVFEHIRADQTAALDPPSPTVNALFTALKWDDSGWPDKALFEPLFRQVLGRPIYAGEPERGRVRDMARQGFKALPDSEIARLKLDVPLPEAQQNALLTELEASHCGLVPKAHFTNMAAAQRYRDAYLADIAIAAAANHGAAIVFTGNGHARRDRGAPFALKQRGFDKPVLVVLFTESAPDKVYPEVADIVVATKPANRKDPCEEMRARFGKKP